MSAVLQKDHDPLLSDHECRSHTLKNTTQQCLELYFDQLEGHKPDNLYRLVMDEVEAPMLECVMNYCRGNQTLAAEYLGLSRGTLRKKLKVHGLG